MNTQVQVVDNTGWARAYPLNETITQIGSDPGNDIVLDAGRGGVMSRHVQIVRWPDAGDMCRLVNLSAVPIALQGAGGRAVAPRAAAELRSGETFVVGEFTLTLSLGDEMLPSIAGGRAPVSHRSGQYIGLELALPANRLSPGQVLEGELLIRNMGEVEITQCELDLEGLPVDCYQIEPAPVLCPGGEERIRLWLYHRYTRPVAGVRQIVIRVLRTRSASQNAPQVYSAEEAMASCRLHVLPCYRHSMRLLLPGQSVEAVPARSEQQGARPAEQRTVRPAEQRTARLEAAHEPPRAARPDESALPAAAQEPARAGHEEPAGAASGAQSQRDAAGPRGNGGRQNAPEPEPEWWPEDPLGAAAGSESAVPKVKVIKAKAAIDGGTT